MKFMGIDVIVDERMPPNGILMLPNRPHPYEVTQIWIEECDQIPPEFFNKLVTHGTSWVQFQSKGATMLDDTKPLPPAHPTWSPNIPSAEHAASVEYRLSALEENAQERANTTFPDIEARLKALEARLTAPESSADPSSIPT